MGKCKANEVVESTARFTLTRVAYIHPLVCEQSPFSKHTGNHVVQSSSPRVDSLSVSDTCDDSDTHTATTHGYHRIKGWLLRIECTARCKGRRRARSTLRDGGVIFCFDFTDNPFSASLLQSSSSTETELQLSKVDAPPRVELRAEEANIKLGVPSHLQYNRNNYPLAARLTAIVI
eukprot:scaffold1750_cov189-Alexandrium_tamarense.AAC.19